MVLAGRIGVMAEGRIVQVGTPGEIYEFPANRHVASFVGNINVIDGRVSRSGAGRVALHCDALNAELSVLCDDALADGTPLSVAVRPEKITISRSPPAGNDHNVLKGTVRDLGYFGDQSLYRVKLAGGTVLQVSAQNLKRTARLTVEWDDECTSRGKWPAPSCCAYDRHRSNEITSPGCGERLRCRTCGCCCSSSRRS